MLVSLGSFLPAFHSNNVTCFVGYFYHNMPGVECPHSNEPPLMGSQTIYMKAHCLLLFEYATKGWSFVISYELAT